MQKKYLNNFFRGHDGYTLVEMLVSLFIIAMLTGIFLANYHGANERNKLILSAQQLASDIRLAQSYALGAKNYNNSPQGGWGVYFHEGGSQYTIFANLQDIEDAYGDIYDLNDGVFKKINLPEKIIIDDIDLGYAAHIIFVAPDPDNYINYDNNTDTNNNAVRITLRNTNDNTAKTVEVNFFGLIDVVD